MSTLGQALIATLYLLKLVICRSAWLKNSWYPRPLIGLVDVSSFIMFVNHSWEQGQVLAYII